jgi:glycosyltransferase involved in cell wall biosynthesis
LYEAINVTCRVVPEMPRVSSLPRLSRNLYAYARAIPAFWRARSFRHALRNAAQDRFDLVHFNHEGLFLLAGWLARNSPVPLTCHVRTMLIDTPFARWQMRRLVKATEALVFITENEKSNVERLTGRAPGPVIHNIATAASGSVQSHPAVPVDNRLKVLALSNYAWVRGTDRLIDVAVRLKVRGRTDILFVVAGDMTLTSSLPGILGEVGRGGGDLAAVAGRVGVDDLFLFLGSVAAPESVLVAADLLVRPSREGHPWGREVIEAMAAGKPVLATGRWDGYVRPGENGFLYDNFDPEDMANDLIRLADDRETVRRLGDAAKAHVSDLCDGPARAGELLDVWESCTRP